MKESFSITIASVPDRDSLVAEIWFSNELVMEISNSNSDFQVDIYQSTGNMPWRFQYKELIAALEDAKKKLITT